MKKSLFFVCLAVLFGLTACKPEPEPEPQLDYVVTEQPTDVQCYHATLNFSLNIPVEMQGSSVYAELTLSTSGEKDRVFQFKEIDGGAKKSINTTFDDLVPNTEYTYNATVYLKDGSIANGKPVKFSTKPLTFSVAPGKHVEFASHNVNFTTNTGDWTFATNHNFKGLDNVKDPAHNAITLDLFGWGTGKNPTNRSIIASDYATFNDWGANFSGGWRTLTADEWDYLLFKRPHAKQLIMPGSYDNISTRGMVIMPDQAYEGMSDSEIEMYEADWTNETEYFLGLIDDKSIEKYHFVFLPFAGICMGSTMDEKDCTSEVIYWSATGENSTAMAVYLDLGKEPKIQGLSKTLGGSVRLVRDVE